MKERLEMVWEDGELVIEDVVFEYQVKLLHYASKNGINDGRILKLTIWRDGEEIAGYDWGWKTIPENELDKQALGEVLQEFS